MAQIYSSLVSTAFLLVFAFTSIHALTLRAVFDSNGVSGSVTFNQTVAGGQTSVSGSLSDGSFTGWQINSLPVLYDVADRCAVTGSRYTSLGSPASNAVSQTINSADLPDLSILNGRSLILNDPNNPTSIACANLEPIEGDIITAEARFKDTIGGRVVFRQSSGPNPSSTAIYVDVFYLNGTLTPADYQWAIYSEEINESASIADRCSNLMTVYNPTSTDGSGCSMGSHENCKAGDMSGKNGNVSVTVNKGDQAQAFVDKHLSLSGSTSVVGRSLVLMASNEVKYCAKIIQYTTREATVTFSRDNVEGTISFSQRSPFDKTNVHVNISGLAGLSGGYHVHNWPVPLKMTADQAVCGNEFVSGHFNPFNVMQFGTTTDQFEVGDLSGKHGMLNGLQSLDSQYVDYNLPLFGVQSIIGRSVVIHKQADGSRWVCATIQPTGTVLQAVAKFTYPVIGYIYLQQAQTDGILSDTQVYAELDYGTSDSATTNHNWHVHVHPMDDSYDMSDPQRCVSVLGHYNPHSVDLLGNYGNECNSLNQLRCEVGDLSGKHGQLDVRGPSGGKTRAFFTDIDLPLTGPNSVMGKSIVIHAANSGGPRLSCANLYDTPARVTKVEDWSSSSYMGVTTFTSKTIGVLDGLTSVHLNLDHLQMSASGYHVHEYPVPGGNAPCSPGSVGGHYNPLGVSGSPVDKSDDQYEIGDLSGKYDKPLDGKDVATWSGVDTNLPIRGVHSVVGRSVVVHYTNGSRWKCGNIVEDTAITNGQLYQAKAIFTGEVEGQIVLSQYQYPDKGLSDTGILIDLKYPGSSKVTQNHPWHVHVKPFGKKGDCMSPGGHYNPFMVSLAEYSECSTTNPLRCESGDLSAKHANYDIGGGKRFYTDVNLNIVDQFGVVGRSIVIHHADGSRFVCADIMPVTTVKQQMVFYSEKDTLDKTDFMVTIAAALQSADVNMAVEPGPDGRGCMEATVLFTGSNARMMQQKLDNMVSSDDPALGIYRPARVTCGSGSGRSGGYFLFHLWQLFYRLFFTA